MRDPITPAITAASGHPVALYYLNISPASRGVVTSLLSLPVFVLFRKGTGRVSMLRRTVESGFAAPASSGKFPRGFP